MEYRKVNHFLPYLNNSPELEIHIIKKIKQEIAKRYLPYNINNIRKVLKDIRYNKYYEYVLHLYIIFVSNGRDKIPVPSHEVQASIIQRYYRKYVIMTWHEQLESFKENGYLCIMIRVLEFVESD